MTTSTDALGASLAGTHRAARTLPARRRSAATLPVVLGALGAALTATGSWIPSFWGDEAATAMSAQRSWPSLLLELQHVDAVHGAYYALMHLWVGVFGATPFALRLPSALALGAAVAGTTVLVRLTGGGRTTAVTVALCTMLLPRLSYQGAEARAYALDAAVTTWIVVAACATLRGRLRPPVGWATVAVLTTIGTYLFLYLGLMVAVAGALAACSPERRSHLRAWGIAAIVTAVAVAPVAVVGMLQKSQVAFLAHRATTDTYSVLVTVYFGRPWVAAACWTLVAVGTVGAWWRRFRGVQGPRDRGPSLLQVGLLWSFLPLGLLVAANPVAHEFSARYATFTAPGAALLVAVGIDTIRRRARWAGVTAGILTVALVAPVWLGQRTPTAFNASDWSTIATLVHDRARPGDQVAFDVTVRPSRRMLLALRTYPANFAGLREVQVTTPYWQNTSWDDRALTVQQAAAAGRFRDGRVWLLQDAHRGTVDHEGEAALRDAGFSRVRAWRAPTSELVLYQR